MAALAAAAGLAVGCKSPPRGLVVPAPIVLAQDVRPVDPLFVPQFGALEAAVDEGEDEVARRILARILSLSPDGRSLEMARAFERILDGRELARSVRLRLDSAPAAEPGRFRLSFLASHDRREPVRLRLPPADVEHLITAVDARGIETKELETHLTRALAELEIPPSLTIRVDLFDYALPLGVALAVRERWALELRPGEIEYDDEVLPAASLATEPCERQVLARFLPTAAVDPDELCRYALADVVNTPALLERAVRIAPERREEALAALTPIVERLAEERPEHVARIAPALRWLARTGKPGLDAETWALYLRARLDAVQRPADRPRLDIR